MRTVRRVAFVFLLALAGGGASTFPGPEPAEPEPPAPGVEIAVDAGTRYQTIEGYGTALNTWTRKMRQFYRTEAFQQIYVRDLGFNFLRLNLWGPTLPQQVEDWRNISYKDFDRSIARFEVYFEVIEALKRINPDLRLIGTVWSPPAWMKENDSITDPASGALDGPTEYVIDGEEADNRVLPKYYPHVAKWMAEMVKLFEAAGLPLHAVSPANEPMFTQEFESCLWTAPDLARVTAMLGKRLEAEGFEDMLLYGPETMTGGHWTLFNEVYIDAYMNEARSAEQLDVFATHGYTDGYTADVSKDASRQFRELVASYEAPYWVTEGGTGGHAWPAPLTDVAAALHNAFVSGHASAFVPWQVTGGEPSTHNLMVMDRMTKKTHAVRHFSRFVRPGAVRIEATPSGGAVKASAYVHPEQETVTVVLINATAQRQKVDLTLEQVEGLSAFDAYRTTRDEDEAVQDAVAVSGSATASLAMPAQSMLTLHGQYEPEDR